MPSQKATKESKEIINDIRRLVQSIRMASSESEQSVGLTAAQLFVMHKLGEEGGLSINDLADRTLTHQSSVSVIVQKLEEKGLVSRLRAAEDGRRFELTLSKKGAALLKKAPHSIQERLIKALKKMEPDMRHQFSVTFTSFLSLANIKGDAPMMFDETVTQKRKK